MATYANPFPSKQGPIPSAVGVLVHDRQVFDLAATAGYRPAAAPAINDLIQIFEVPAGCALVPHLSRIAIPVIDSNGTPTGQASIGTAAVPAALRATGTVGTAVQVQSGEDLLEPAAVIGHPDLPTPVYLKFTAAVATLATTGKVVFDGVIRAYRSDIDG